MCNVVPCADENAAGDAFSSAPSSFSLGAGGQLNGDCYDFCVAGQTAGYLLVTADGEISLFIREEFRRPRYLNCAMSRVESLICESGRTPSARVRPTNERGTTIAAALIRRGYRPEGSLTDSRAANLRYARDLLADERTVTLNLECTS